MPNSPVVVLLGYTTMTDEVFDIMDAHEQDSGHIEDVADIDYLHEFAGRQCYSSFHRPNPITAENADYLANILSQQHYSVLAHGHATFRLEGISRSLATELIRSRFLAFSELSQRYVDPVGLDIVYPPDADEQAMASLDMLHSVCMESYKAAFDDYRLRGFSIKRSRSAARSHLPLSIETKIVVSGNMRAWRDFIIQRTGDGAEEEIKRLALLILEILRDIAPNTFSDIKVDV